MFWWMMKYVFLGPILRLFFRPKAEGLEHLTSEGPVILAPNHLSFADDLLVPLVLKGRRATILAKSDYWDHWYTRWFFEAAGCVPVRRDGGSASRAAIDAAVKALHEGRTVMLFPEGTRSPDGRLYRGKTGVARLALETGVPVIPVAVVGTDVVAPPGKKFGTFTRPVVRFGKPLDFSRYEGMENDRYILRSITDEIMYEIMRLSGQEYVDMYASRAKEEIEARAKGPRGQAAAPAAAEAIGAAVGDVVTVPEDASSEGSVSAAEQPADRRPASS